MSPLLLIVPSKHSIHPGAAGRMTVAAALLAALALTGCDPADGIDASSGSDSGTFGSDAAPATDSGPPITPDPDVDSWFPDGYGATAPARVIIFGDSIAAGQGASSNSGSFTSLLAMNDAALWPGFDEEDLESIFGAGVEVIDVSMSGARTDHVVNQQIPAAEGMLTLPAAGETIVVAIIGGNDALAVVTSPGTGPAVVASIDANIRTIATWATDPATFPDGSFFYLANIYEPADGLYQADECFFGFSLPEPVDTLRAANMATRMAAEKLGFAWIDMNGHFLGHGFHSDEPANVYYDAADPTLWFDPDCIHPNDRGHHEIRRLFTAAIDGHPLPAP